MLAKNSVNQWNTVLFTVSLFFVIHTYGQAMQHDSVMHVNVKVMGERADLILIGTLSPVMAKYKETVKTFYKISAEEILKGELTDNSLLVVHQDIDSSEGSHPVIEAHVPYMLFLECVKLDDKVAPQDTTYYQVIQTWKGIIPIIKGAKERRSFQFIEKDYDINFAEKLQDFREAIALYSLQLQGVGQDKSTVKEGALNIYKALGLDDE
jgi:hypothetical protein